MTQDKPRVTQLFCGSVDIMRLITARNSGHDSSTASSPFVAHLKWPLPNDYTTIKKVLPTRKCIKKYIVVK